MIEQMLHQALTDGYRVNIQDVTDGCSWQNCEILDVAEGCVRFRRCSVRNGAVEIWQYVLPLNRIACVWWRTTSIDSSLLARSAAD
ncbi:hypothetical protein [Leptolyngbya sp. FACHB-261]|uniref:hypothetical protein n=1 Tax=Leptolyngbya sp. FACHB-261 TaxID=2692806 RepID=UPI00168A00FB|nr:hypothetical protein [Leptolyngbya sp. FACHB-261]MBD2101332.1 hypothetical protein [Leptolyngbya sp. FACHB-261]